MKSKRRVNWVFSILLKVKLAKDQRQSEEEAKPTQTPMLAPPSPSTEQMDGQVASNDDNLPANDENDMNFEGKEKMSAAQAAEDDTAEETNNSCPLFMDSLPSNFASNSGLAAIASLLNDESDDAENVKEATIRTSETKVKSGGGKATKRRIGMNRHSPYRSPNAKNNEKKETTLGEAQLFLSMWKM